MEQRVIVGLPVFLDAHIPVDESIIGDTIM